MISIPEIVSTLQWVMQNPGGAAVLAGSAMILGIVAHLATEPNNPPRTQPRLPRAPTFWARPDEDVFIDDNRVMPRENRAAA